MCGIAGIVSSKNSSDELRKMAHAMALRGPDGEGFLEKQHQNLYLGLAHKRLSIIDLDTGAQPISNEDDSIWVVLNGEIFNHKKLRSQLEKKGHKFKTNGSDTEVLVHLWEEFGIDIVQHLEGMFAFAILDLRLGSIFLARDRMGIKPLYYSFSGDTLQFASTASALLSVKKQKKIDSSSFSHFLSFQCCPAPNSIFENIKKIPAGHFAKLSFFSHKLEIIKYWELPLRIKKQSVSLEELRHSFSQAVSSWSLSDVPVACSLSGGLDSSLVFSYFAEQSSAPIHAFTLKTEDARIDEDETPYASLMVNRFGAKHHVISITSSQLLHSLDSMINSLDEPYAGGLPSWFVYEQMKKEGFKVCLTGTGGDELFGNYGKFLPLEKFSPRSFYILAKKNRRDLGGLLSILKEDRRENLYKLYLDKKDKRNLLDIPNELMELSEEYIANIWADSTLAAKNAVAKLDFQVQLPEEFLYVTDRFSMAHSIEARTPFLDHKLVELVYSLPPDLRTNAADPKFLLKQMAQGILPNEILNAPKRGFTIPIERWLKKDLSELLHDLTEPNFLRNQGLFHENLRTELKLWIESGHIRKVYKAWTILLFQYWYWKKFSKT